MLNELQSLFDVIADLRQNGSLPIVTFKTNSMSEEVSRLVGVDNCPGDEADGDKIKRWVEEIATASNDITNDPIKLEGGEFSNELVEEMAEAFATKIKAATTKLRDLQVEVATITKDVEVRKNQLIAIDPFLSKHAQVDSSDVTIDYPEFPWDALGVLGGKNNLVGYVLQTAGLDTTTLKGKQLLALVIDRFDSLQLKADKPQTVELSKEIRASIVAKVNEDNKELLVDVIGNTLNMLINPAKTLRIKNKIVNTMRKAEPTEACAEAIKVINDIRPIVSQLITAMSALDVDSAKVSAITSNMQFTDDLTDLLGYYVYWHRENTYADTILFRNGSINPDKVSTLKAQNLTTVDVARSVKYRFGDVMLPTVGITLTSLQQNKDRIDKMADKNESQIKIKLSSGMKRISEEAFFKVVYPYLTDAKDLEAGEVLKKYVRHESGHTSSDSRPVEDVLYHVLLEKCYAGEFVCTLYEELSLEYMKAVGSNKSLSASDVATLNADVYAKLITSFIYSKFCIVPEED